MMASEVEAGAVIAWFRSRSEMGPRALGHRSILADPRNKRLVRFINEKVKSRESFRPFAPSVLAEEAATWFDLGENVPAGGNVSPYMSMTAMVRDEKRSSIPAVTHVDGSSRLQTVTMDDEPMYHKFISKFFALTGVPMVLNTSFNTLPSEPIVETPENAIRAFLYSMGSIELLVMGDYMIRRKKADLQKLLGQMTKDGELVVQPACPKRAGAVSFQTTSDIEAGQTDESNVETITRIRMPDRPMHGNKNEWFELLDDLEGEILAACDGTMTLNEIMAQYSAYPEEEELGNDEAEATQNLLQNIIYRITRLFDNTFIGW
jgi:Carbamoyltransferase C-terminus